VGQLEAGVFTHELLSGSRAPPTSTTTEFIEYSEVRAFVASANRELKDPRSGPKPGGGGSLPPLDARTAARTLAKLSDVRYLSGELSGLGHFHVELDDGERLPRTPT